MLQLKLPDLKRIEAIVQQHPDYISFSQGALRVGGVPPEVRAHVQEVLKTDVADYYGPAAGTRALRSALADHFSQQYHVPFTLNNILVSHGSIGAFSAFCFGVLDQGDEVILPSPTYPVYENVVLTAKGVPVHCPAYQFFDGEWNFDVARVEAAITPRTKIIIFSNPSNPIGYLMQPHERDALIALAEKHNIYLVIDEVYDAFIFEGQLHSITPYILQSKNLVRLGSFSKNAAMSGWRIGYLMADAALVESLIPVQDALFCCPSMIGQHAAAFVLQHPDLMVSSQKKVIESRARVVQKFTEFKQRGLVDFQTPPAGFYLFFKTGVTDSSSWVLDLLNTKGVGLVPGHDFALNAAAWVRLCFAREPELVAQGLARIEEYFSCATTNPFCTDQTQI